jgi:hypothetical protein
MTGLGHGGKAQQLMAGDQEAPLDQPARANRPRRQDGARPAAPLPSVLRKEAAMQTDPQGFFDGN